MTVPRLNKIVEYWQYNAPPAYRSLAASIGFKPKTRIKEVSKISEEENEQAARALMMMFPQTRRPKTKVLEAPSV